MAVVVAAFAVESPFFDQDEFDVVESGPLAQDAGFDLAGEAAEVVVASPSAAVVA